VTAAEKALRAVKAAGRRAGLELLRFNPTNSLDAARPLVVRGQAVDLVLDVGANQGQWAGELRTEGYDGPLVSFEPFGGAFERLRAAAEGDHAWEARRLALGDTNGEVSLYVAANRGASSSLLRMTDAHTDAAPNAGVVNEERVTLARLDDVELPAGERVFLKLDVQGGERAVLDGAPETLQRVRVIECELSLVELYEGQALLAEQLARLEGLGFRLWGLQPSFADWQTGRLLQVDGLFVRD
jgi:FkbM family methyltransferase